MQILKGSGMPLSKLVFGFICLLVVTLVIWANVCEVTALVVDEAKSLDEDQFWYDEFAINMSVEVRVSAEISSGPAVDLYVVDKLSFDGLQRVMAGKLGIDKLQFDYVEALSREGLAGAFESSWQVMATGTYYVIIDNSIFGQAAPPLDAVNDRVRFTIKVETKM